MAVIVKKIIKDVIPYFCIFMVCFAISKFLLKPTIINGESMLPTFKNGQFCLINKTRNLTKKGYKRNEIVVAWCKERNYFIIKRVIGLPNEEIQIVDGYVYINGEKLKEKETFDAMETSGVVAQKLTLDDDEYFLLGDNRNHSGDSREFGPFSEKEISGNIVFRFFPFTIF